MMSRLKNPMRFSLRNRTVDFSEFEVNVEEFEMRPDEGQLYVYWKPPVCTNCLNLADKMYNWERHDIEEDGNRVMWTCPKHTPEMDIPIEEYDTHNYNTHG